LILGAILDGRLLAGGTTRGHGQCKQSGPQKLVHLPLLDLLKRLRMKRLQKGSAGLTSP
jgi:hypothetical protein